MHMQNNPQNMQVNPTYHNVVQENIDFLTQRINYATENKIDYKQIILDPGFGFGKNLQHNIELLFNLARFKSFNLPIKTSKMLFEFGHFWVIKNLNTLWTLPEFLT